MITLFIQSPDKLNRIDPSLSQRLFSFLPNQVKTEPEADAIIVPITWMPEFQFNEELERITKPVIVVDMFEYGSNWSGGHTHLFGTDSDALSASLEAPYNRFSEWVASRQPVLYFKRELLAKDQTERVKPIEWPCYLPISPIQTREEFEKRPIEVLNWWGYSHDSRPLLHAAIFKAMVTHGINVLSDWKHVPSNRSWASIHVPHYNRVSIEIIANWQFQSKITTALWGNGRKCFRHGELVDTIMALPCDNLAWSFPWENNTNCIRLHENFIFADLQASTHRPNLYEIYVAGQENMARYQSARYVNEYILPAIESAL